jgi:arylsulfatase A-like enzyme
VAGQGRRGSRRSAFRDVAPTLLAAAQTTQNLSTFDGYDILGAHSRQRAYTEYYYDTGNNNGIPTWASITTPTYQYVEYYGLSNAMTQVSFREYYDMVNDPYQLVNLYNDGNPNNDPNTATLSAALASAKTCVGTACP